MEYKNVGSFSAYLENAKKYAKEFFVDKTLYIGGKTVSYIKNPLFEYFGGAITMVGPLAIQPIREILAKGFVEGFATKSSIPAYTGNPNLDIVIFLAHLVSGSTLIVHGGRRAIEHSANVSKER